MGLLAYGGIFWLALQCCRPRARAHQVLVALAAGGLLYAAYGLYDASGSDAGIVTSTFVNRNSYATYAGMTLFCGLGLVLRGLARQARAGLSLRRVASGRCWPGSTHRIGARRHHLPGRRQRAASDPVARRLRRAVRSGRRLRVVVQADGADELRASSSRPPRCARSAWRSASSGSRARRRSGGSPDADVHASSRLAYYRTTWQAIGDRPLLGTGYGTYADAFRAYNHPGTGTYFLDKAHSTYLQMIMELGWPAALALYAGVALLVLRCLRGRSGVVSSRARLLLGAGRGPFAGRLQPRDAGECRHLRLAARRRLRAIGPRPSRPRLDPTAAAHRRSLLRMTWPVIYVAAAWLPNCSCSVRHQP